jgi:predicted nucleic acid-binding protein
MRWERPRPECGLRSRSGRADVPYLQANALLIGANDLWIAAAGLAHGLPVVTRNAQHYSRVPGLEVIGY